MISGFAGHICNNRYVGSFLFERDFIFMSDFNSMIGVQYCVGVDHTLGRNNGKTPCSSSANPPPT